MLTALAFGAMHDLVRRRLGAVGAPVARQAGALELGKAGRKAQAGGRRRGNAAGACGHARGIEGLQRTPSGIIIALVGGDAGGNAPGCGRILEALGDQGEGVIDTSQALQHHGFNGFSDGAVPYGWVVVGRVVEDVTKAECVAHPGDEAEVIQYCTVLLGVVGHNALLAVGEEMVKNL